jgi:hypothetical protein
MVNIGSETLNCGDQQVTPVTSRALKVVKHRTQSVKSAKQGRKVGDLEKRAFVDQDALENTAL